MRHGARSTVIIIHPHVASSKIALKKKYEERSSELSKKMDSEIRKFSDFQFNPKELSKREYIYSAPKGRLSRYYSGILNYVFSKFHVF